MEVTTCIAWFVTLCMAYAFIRRLFGTRTIGSFCDKYILITGCDSGFGKEACIRFCNMGFKVFAGCFTEEGIEYFKSYTNGVGKVIPFQLDVTSEVSIKEAGKFVRKQLPENRGLWALINNAGVSGATVPVLWQSRKTYEDCLKVNLLGPIDVVKEFFILLKQERGRVINMTSMMGRIAVPNLSPYNASKYALEAFSDCLRREVRKFGVSVHIIEPGFFKTSITDPKGPHMNLIQRCFDDAPTDIQVLYESESATEVKRRLKMFLERSSPKTYLVTDAYIHAVTSTSPKSRYLIGWDARTLFRLLWSIPTFLADTFFEILSNRNKLKTERAS